MIWDTLDPLGKVINILLLSACRTDGPITKSVTTYHDGSTRTVTIDGISGITTVEAGAAPSKVSRGITMAEAGAALGEALEDSWPFGLNLVLPPNI